MGKTTTTSRPILTICNTCVQGGSKEMLDGSFVVFTASGLLTFQFRSNVSLNGKSRRPSDTFSITFTIDDISALSISTPIEGYETLNFVSQKQLPSFFIPLGALHSSATLINTLIEQGYTVVPSVDIIRQHHSPAGKTAQRPHLQCTRSSKPKTR